MTVSELINLLLEQDQNALVLRADSNPGEFGEGAEAVETVTAEPAINGLDSNNPIDVVVLA